VAERMLNFRASDELHELVARAVELAEVDRSFWLREVITRAAKLEVGTHRQQPFPTGVLGLEPNGHRPIVAG
jgi:uncharacterized protein (DUF1778 family)